MHQKNLLPELMSSHMFLSTKRSNTIWEIQVSLHNGLNETYDFELFYDLQQGQLIIINF